MYADIFCIFYFIFDVSLCIPARACYRKGQRARVVQRVSVSLNAADMVKDKQQRDRRATKHKEAKAKREAAAAAADAAPTQAKKAKAQPKPKAKRKAKKTN
eukprot:m.223221 g.223221  ORF g.223221 m.223221 type:complete len:101 (-) comp15137_c1_seq2:133-435(-)